MPEFKNKVVDVQELQLGDIVEIFEGSYGQATVQQIDGGKVTVFWPYVHTSEFSYSRNQVICYLDTETLEIRGNVKLIYRLREPVK